MEDSKTKGEESHKDDVNSLKSNNCHLMESIVVYETQINTMKKEKERDTEELKEKITILKKRKHDDADIYNKEIAQLKKRNNEEVREFKTEIAKIQESRNYSMRIMQETEECRKEIESIENPKM